MNELVHSNKETDKPTRRKAVAGAAPAASKAGGAKAPTRTNDPARTMAGILEVATKEFADKGLSGARIDAIAEATHTSKRMIYYYYGSKEGLYLAVLEESYRRMRQIEAELHLEDLEPEAALRRLVEFTFDRQLARDWCTNGSVVFCRTLTRASEGKGIVVAETVDQLVNAPVYTKYMKKKREFRVHIFKDKVVQIVEKRKRSGWDANRDTRIRNTANGYVFCRDLLSPAPSGLAELALKASKVTQSDFKGVDIGYNEKKDELFVIEVNSAPGVQGSNVDDYVTAILTEST